MSVDENVLVYYEGLWGCGKTHTIDKTYPGTSITNSGKHLKGFRFAKYMSCVNQYERHLNKGSNTNFKVYYCDRSPYSYQFLINNEMLRADIGFLGIENAYSSEKIEATKAQVKSLIGDFEEYILSVSKKGKIRFEILVPRDLGTYHRNFIEAQEGDWAKSKELKINPNLIQVQALQNFTIDSCLNLRDKAEDKNNIEVITRYTPLF